jgi:Flp pilus assembly protein TadB
MRVTDPGSPDDRHRLDPVLFAAFERMSAKVREERAELPEISEFESRVTTAEARIREAEARTAESRADFEPQRQRLALAERRTRLAMSVVATLFAMAYLVGALLIAPWVLPPTGIAAAVAYRWR